VNGNADDRLHRLYQAINRRDGHGDPLARVQAICDACVEVLPVTGAGVMLMAERVHQGTLYVTDAMIQRLEELQNSVAEGPCIDAYQLGRPVLQGDLTGAGRRMWPLLAPTALEAGIQALFSFPLEIDAASIGALNLYRDRPGPLAHAAVHDARLLAAMATREILDLQADAAPGSLPSRIADLSGDRAIIEQATGMVAAQLDADVLAGGRRLRQVAMEQGRPLAEIAREVVARKLRLGWPSLMTRSWGDVLLQGPGPRRGCRSEGGGRPPARGCRSSFVGGAARTVSPAA
jgi:hypothetical protein